jgi:hypothetical protein
MFQLTPEEVERLRSQIATSKTGQGGRRYHPYVFTEQEVTMTLAPQLWSSLRGKGERPYFPSNLLSKEKLQLKGRCKYNSATVGGT